MSLQFQCEYSHFCRFASSPKQESDFMRQSLLWSLTGCQVLSWQMTELNIKEEDIEHLRHRVSERPLPDSVIRITAQYMCNECMRMALQSITLQNCCFYKLHSQEGTTRIHPKSQKETADCSHLHQFSTKTKQEQTSPPSHAPSQQSPSHHTRRMLKIWKPWGFFPTVPGLEPSSTDPL